MGDSPPPSGRCQRGKRTPGDEPDGERDRNLEHEPEHDGRRREKPRDLTRVHQPLEVLLREEDEGRERGERPRGRRLQAGAEPGEGDRQDRCEQDRLRRVLQVRVRRPDRRTRQPVGDSVRDERARGDERRDDDPGTEPVHAADDRGRTAYTHVRPTARGRRMSVPDSAVVPPASLAVLSATLVALAALAGAAALRLRSLPEFLLAAYVLAVTEVVALLLVLSPFSAVRRPVLLAGLSVGCALGLGSWWRAGRPRPPWLSGARASVRELRASAPVTALLVAVGAAGSYAVALALGSPPVTWDSLRYHLTRAAFWRQDGAVGYIANAYDARINANPPNGEILLTFVLELARDERLTAFVQLVAWLACFAGVVALARRLGLARSEACFGGAAFVLLPIVVLQSSTTHNDLVLASLLLAATVFATRTSGRELALAGLAVGLAVGTKVTAVYAAPILLAVAVLAAPRRAWMRRTAALAAGAGAGTYWYVVNALHTDEVLGGTPDRGHIETFEPAANLLAALARVLDATELPGVHGWGAYAYVLAAIGFATVLLLLARTRRMGTRSALVAGALAFAPLLLLPASYATWRVLAKLHDVSGAAPGLLPLDRWEPQTLASEDQSWYGPVGLLLVVGVGAFALVLVRRRALPALAAVLAMAPLAWLVLMSATLGYDPWQGRFFAYPVALSAALWGTVLRWPPVAGATAAVTITIAGLTLVQYEQKPLTVWPTAARWELQSRQRAEMGPLLRHLDERVEPDATVALALRGNEWGYPAFGPGLERRALLLDAGSSGTDLEADWLLADTDRAGEIDRTCWEVAVATGSGTLFERSRERCPDRAAP